LGLEQTFGSLSYAFLAGGAAPLRQPSLSGVSEWTAAAELGWQSPRPLGIRASARLGLSLLSLDLHEGVATSSGTLEAAGLLELNVSRPIWLGRFGLAPGLGVRAYTAKRALTIEGEPELQLAMLSARLLLSLLVRVSD